MVYHWTSLNVSEMYLLVLISWSFEFYKGSVEQWNKSVDETFGGSIECRMEYWVHVVDVAGDSAKRM